MTCYVIAEDGFPDIGPPVASLPPGHHHVHVGEDGTIDVNPLVRHGLKWPASLTAWPDETTRNTNPSVVLWVDAPKETP